MKALLEAGANPDGSQRNISTPIHIAARDDFPEAMSLLIEHGADVNGRHVATNCNEKESAYPGNSPIYMTIGNKITYKTQNLVKSKC